MNNNEKKEAARITIAEQCIGCGICREDCQLLQEIDEDPSAIALRGPTMDEAYACFLCNQCEAVCPLDLSPGRMFAERREEAVRNGEIDIEELRYVFPDRPLNIMGMFRHVNQIDYQDLNQSVPGKIGFFPGCTMMTYASVMTRKVYHTLAEIYPDLVFMPDCCAKPFYQLGMEERGEKYRIRLKAKINHLGIKSLVTACPNCYYELQEVLAGQDIQIVTVYEILKGSFQSQPNMEATPVKCTIHDSCPDRLAGIFGRQVREALRDASYEVVEMAHNLDTSFCCGSGGQVSHFRPDFAEEVVRRRLQEARDTKAEILVAYCLNCVLNLTRNPSGLTIKHALNLLLDVDEDYDGLKNKVQEMFSGPDGEEIWQEIMAEPERNNEDE
jgi:Fe-S oxidoreductase